MPPACPLRCAALSCAVQRSACDANWRCFFLFAAAVFVLQKNLKQRVSVCCTNKR
jgi:hypothetical protein